MKCEPCPSCEAWTINGIYCHETGCPDSWRYTIRNCPWCGTDFEPESMNHKFCNDSCYAAYYNLPIEDDYDDLEEYSYASMNAAPPAGF